MYDTNELYVDFVLYRNQKCKPKILVIKCMMKKTVKQLCIMDNVLVTLMFVNSK